MTESETSALVFDVRAVNSHLDQVKRQRRYGSLLFLAFVLVIALVFWFEFGPALEKGTISLIPLAGLIIVLGLAVAILLTILSGWRSLQPGPLTLRSSENEFELDYPDGRVDQFVLSTPGLAFQLHDFSKVDQALLTAGTPYFLLIRRAHAALTTEAYNAVLTQVEARGMIERTGKGKRWIFSAANSPTILHVRSRGGSVRQTAGTTAGK